MKKIIAVVFSALLLVGSLTAAVVPGSGPTPTCNPLTDPNCPPPLPPS